MRMLLPPCVIVGAISHQPVDNQFNLGKVVNLKTATWAINLANYMLLPIKVTVGHPGGLGLCFR